MIQLNVNISSLATLLPTHVEIKKLINLTYNLEKFGIQGITFALFSDTSLQDEMLFVLKETVSTEFCLEGVFSEKFIEKIKALKPNRVFLVPKYIDGKIVANSKCYLEKKTDLCASIAELHALGIPSYCIVEPDIQQIEQVAFLNADGIVFNMNMYDVDYRNYSDKAIVPYLTATEIARQHALSIATIGGLTLQNSRFLIQKIPDIQCAILEVNFLFDALYFGLENAVQMYLSQLS
jgi:pyridoxine 5-phosphate synthase